MTLPLRYILIPSNVPLPLSRIAFLIRLGYAYSEQLREQLTKEWTTARTLMYDVYRQIESGELNPLRPFTKDVVSQMVYGELLDVPRDLCFPQIYEWMRTSVKAPAIVLEDKKAIFSSGVVTKLPWYLKSIQDASDALQRANALETFRIVLERRAKEEGFTGDYDAPLLWMLFTHRATPELYGTGPGAKELISALGDHELTYYLMNGEMHDIHDAVSSIIHGIRYSNRRMGHGTADI